ncbi:hypothetical protein T4A_4129 [Trichinella pseudospiralis]|uniref:Uncharacterized protein n=1 Tax=Trichinella pseudospiralis TaxID=6337 RepID=A0A0V1DT18_TRIPS|nr:hypothetical protein T4A_4129 [Trichinella pseudospiralis]
MISSKYAATLAMRANIVSITFRKIASAEGTPEGRLYVNFLDSASSSTCKYAFVKSNLWLSTFEHFHIPCLVQLKWQRKVARNVRYCHMHDAAMLISNDESP